MKEQACIDLVEDKWMTRAEDLKDPEYEALSFDYVEPHTWDNQPEGYWRWQFSWGGPSDELRAYVNEHYEIHRLEYWYLDWGDGASILLDQDYTPAWQQMQEMIGTLDDPTHCIAASNPSPRSGAAAALQLPAAEVCLLMPPLHSISEMFWCI